MNQYGRLDAVLKYSKTYVANLGKIQRENIKMQQKTAEDSLKKGEKECTKCHRIKKLEKFNRDRHTLDGRQYNCRNCQRKENRKYWKNKNLKRQIASLICKGYFFNEIAKKLKISNSLIGKLAKGVEINDFIKKKRVQRLAEKGYNNQQIAAFPLLKISENQVEEWLKETVIIPQGKKICSKCGEPKLMGDFSRNKSHHKDGRRSECKKCQGKYLRNWQKKKKKELDKNQESETTEELSTEKDLGSLTDEFKDWSDLSVTPLKYIIEDGEEAKRHFNKMKKNLEYSSPLFSRCILILTTAKRELKKFVEGEKQLIEVVEKRGKDMESFLKAIDGMNKLKNFFTEASK